MANAVNTPFAPSNQTLVLSIALVSSFDNNRLYICIAFRWVFRKTSNGIVWKCICRGIDGKRSMSQSYSYTYTKNWLETNLWMTQFFKAWNFWDLPFIVHHMPSNLLPFDEWIRNSCWLHNTSQLLYTLKMAPMIHLLNHLRVCISFSYCVHWPNESRWWDQWWLIRRYLCLFPI